MQIPDLPNEIDGFTNCLLWLVATRATALVDRLFTAGLAHPPTGARTKKGDDDREAPVMADGHYIPTPALIARLIAAGELAREQGTGVEDRSAWAMDLPTFLAGLDAEGKALARGRMRELRTAVPRALRAPPSFKEAWITDLAAVCGLTPDEADYLRVIRGYKKEPVDLPVLARVIERTLQAPAARPGTPRAAAPGRTPSRTLPRGPVAFTGRADELRRLLTETAGTAGAADTEAAVRVFTIGGLAGIGKTALAKHAAHRLAPRFPDGQFFLLLHGHTPDQPTVDPENALASLLVMAGVAPGQIPSGAEPKAALWRSLNAGRRILLVLDDASDAAQVEPLLPGTPGSLVLITSRLRLTSLTGTRAIPLDPLSPEESVQLFIALADRPEPEPGLDPEQVARIADLCGHLPLAIEVLARQLHHHPAWSAAGLAADQAAARERLRPLANDDPAVTAAFDVSSAGLPGDLRRLLRLLGLFPGSEIEPWAVAALAGTTPAAARNGLNALYGRHLLTETAPGRFLLHDLMRDYVIRLAEQDPGQERAAATARLADFYLGAAVNAGRLVTAGRRRVAIPSPVGDAPVAIPELADLDAADQWLVTERLNLDALLRRTASRYPAHAVAILAACTAFLTRGHGAQGLQLSRSVVAAAETVEDGTLQGWAYLAVAEFERATGDLRAALTSTGQALELFGATGEPTGEADATLHRGWLDYLTDDYEGARRYLSRSLALFRSLDDATGKAHALSHLCYLDYLVRDYQAALAKAQEAALIYAQHELSDGQRGAVHLLAVVQQETGDFESAMANFTTAVDLSLRLRDKHGEAFERTHLAYLQILTGHDDDAVAGLTAALRAHRDVGNKLGEATALNYLGVAQRRAGDAAAAVTSQQRAAELYQDCGSRLGEANARLELGRAQHQLSGQLAQALATTKLALQVFRDLEDTVSEAEARNNIGDFYLAAGDQAAARDSYLLALALIGDDAVPLERARATDGIARTERR